eukprot:IDg2982t1
MKLFMSANDQALITLTGFDHNAFNYILYKFAHLYIIYSPYSSTGMVTRLQRPARRPRSLTALQCLGLILTWGRTRGSAMVLCMLFGITASVSSLFLRFGRRILLSALKSDDNAEVRMPTGWTHDRYVGNVFVFAPDGCIISCATNAPGAMQDSTIAEWGNIYSKLEACYDAFGGRCVVDSAFCKTQYPFLIKSAQDHLTSAADAADVIHLIQATSARQVYEWGMRALQECFSRLKDRMPYEERGERKLILHLSSEPSIVFAKFVKLYFLTSDIMNISIKRSCRLLSFSALLAPPPVPLLSLSSPSPLRPLFGGALHAAPVSKFLLLTLRSPHLFVLFPPCLLLHHLELIQLNQICSSAPNFLFCTPSVHKGCSVAVESSSKDWSPSSRHQTQMCKDIVRVLPLTDISTLSHVEANALSFCNFWGNSRVPRRDLSAMKGRKLAF